MNGVAQHQRDTNPPGPYFPFHRDETYPRTLCVNFKRLEEAPSVDEEGVMTSFLQKVVDPERPYRPKIDLTLAAQGTAGDKDRIRAGQPAAMMSDVGATGGMGGSPSDADGGAGGGARGADSGGGGGGGGGGGHFQTPSDLPEHPRMMSGYDDGARPDGYSRRPGVMMKGMMGGDRGGAVGDGGGRRGSGSGGGGGGGCDHSEYDYGPSNSRDRAMSQMGLVWDPDSHGGDAMPKSTSKRSPAGRGRFGNNNNRGPAPTGTSSSAPTHGGGAAITDRGSSSNRGGGGGGDPGGGVGEESKPRKQKQDRGGGSGSNSSGAAGAGGSGGGDSSVKSPPGKKRKGGGGWRAKNGEQVAVKDDRDEPGTWILARVIKYTPETHQYELRDDDDKEGLGGLTAPRSSVIRLEDSTKGVGKGDRVLAVFPDTTSFYLGTVHRVPKVPAGAEKRIEIKFQDDEDASGRTPARPMPARYVVLVPDGYDEEMGQVKAEEEEADGGEEALPADGGSGGGGGRGASRGGSDTREEEFADAMEEDDGEPRYADMIRAALLKLPGRQGTLPMVYAYIEEHFHDRLDWKSDSNVRRTPAWKSGVRRTIAHHPNFCHADTPERNVYTLAE